MAGSAKIFEQDYQQDCEQLAEINLDAINDEPGLVADGHKIFIPFLNSR